MVYIKLNLINKVNLYILNNNQINSVNTETLEKIVENIKEDDDAEEIMDKL
jgi:hypothetical protein